jgi:DNA-binding MarR family transcriptional regulator
MGEVSQWDVSADVDRDSLPASVLGVISDRLQDLIRDFQRLRAHVANASEPDSEWALNRLIVALVREGPLRLMELAAVTHCDASTVSRQVAALVASGYLERLPDPDDGRASLLRPTAAAHERYRSFLVARARREEDVLSAWPEADRTRFAELLTRYSKDFRSYYVAQLGPSRRRSELSLVDASASNETAVDG